MSQNLMTITLNNVVFPGLDLMLDLTPARKKQDTWTDC